MLNCYVHQTLIFHADSAAYGDLHPSIALVIRHNACLLHSQPENLPLVFGRNYKDVDDSKQIDLPDMTVCFNRAIILPLTAAKT